MNFDDATTHLKLVGGIDYERLRLDIPTDCRGVLFERIFEGNHPQENTRRLEVGFVEEWAEKNKHALLQTILSTDSDDPQRKRLPVTAQEWQVAELVAASIIQWLPTSIGCAFLRDAFERGGGKFSYALPLVTEDSLTEEMN